MSSLVRRAGLVLLAVAAVAAADVGGLMRQGNGLYARRRFDEALARYQQAQVLEPDATKIHYNLGNTLYRLGRYDEALGELSLSLADKRAGARANTLYNTGNVLFKSGKLDAAIQAYIQALVQNPRDKQAKQNLEYCLLKKAEQQRDSSNQQQQQQQNQNQNQNQQQQQQPQPEPGMGKDQAERLVQAVEAKERDQQRQQQQRGGRRKVDRDW
jgi:tetratricopeptide (TPR) repeat protein